MCVLSEEQHRFLWYSSLWLLCYISVKKQSTFFRLTVLFNLYADDTVLYIYRHDFDPWVKKLQEDINALARWCMANGIAANTYKTKVMVFGSKGPFPLGQFAVGRLQ